MRTLKQPPPLPPVAKKQLPKRPKMPPPIPKSVQKPRLPEPMEPEPVSGIRPVKPTGRPRRKQSSNSPLPIIDSTRSSMPSAIDLTSQLEDPENLVKIDVYRELHHLRADKTFQALANLCARLRPSLTGSEFRFEMDGVMLGRNQIGDFSGEPNSVHARIFLNKLGFSIDTLPKAAILNEFDVSPQKLAHALALAKGSALEAREVWGKMHLRLGLYDSNGELVGSFSPKTNE